MRDGSLVSLVKRVVRVVWSIEVGVRRALVGRRRYELRGSCGGCAKCCEAPGIQVGFVTWHFPTVQRVFLFYQYVVNGFEYLRKDRTSRTFTFRCTHFDSETRRCDSYETRPFMCRDYPRLLLEQPIPDLFEECGYRAFDREGQRLHAAIEGAGLDPEMKAKLKRRLHLYEGP